MAKQPRVTVEQLEKLMDQHERLPIPHMADIAAAFIDEMGGPSQLGKLMAVEFTAAKAGSLPRAKMLEIIFRALRQESQLPPVENMDGATLRRLLITSLQDYEKMNVASDATSEPAARRQGEGEATGGAQGSSATPDPPGDEKTGGAEASV